MAAWALYVLLEQPVMRAAGGPGSLLQASSHHQRLQRSIEKAPPLKRGHHPCQVASLGRLTACWADRAHPAGDQLDSRPEEQGVDRSSCRQNTRCARSTNGSAGGLNCTASSARMPNQIMNTL